MSFLESGKLYMHLNQNWDLWGLKYFTEFVCTTTAKICQKIWHNDFRKLLRFRVSQGFPLLVCLFSIVCRAAGWDEMKKNGKKYIISIFQSVGLIGWNYIFFMTYCTSVMVETFSISNVITLPHQFSLRIIVSKTNTSLGKYTFSICYHLHHYWHNIIVLIIWRKEQIFLAWFCIVSNVRVTFKNNDISLQNLGFDVCFLWYYLSSHKWGGSTKRRPDFNFLRTGNTFLPQGWSASASLLGPSQFLLA